MALSQKKPERDALLLADAKNGQTPAQLAIKYKISVGAVSIAFKRMGFSRVGYRKENGIMGIKPQRNAEIVAAIKNGESIQNIALRYAIDEEAIRAILRKYEPLLYKKLKNEIEQKRLKAREEAKRATAAQKKAIEAAEIAARKTEIAAILKHNPLPPGASRNARIVALAIKNKHTLAEIGKRFNITRERVRQILKRYGIHIKRTSETTERNISICTDYKNGLTQVQLEAKYNLSHQAVYDILKTEIKDFVPDYKKQKQKTKQFIVKSFLAGHSYEKIAESVPYHKYYVRALLIKLGYVKVKLSSRPDVVARRRKQIAENIKAGKSLLYIGKTQKVCYLIMYQIAIKEGLREEYNALHRQRNKALIKDFVKGMSMEDILKKYKLPLFTVKLIIGKTRMKQANYKDMQ